MQAYLRHRLIVLLQVGPCRGCRTEDSMRHRRIDFFFPEMRARYLPREAQEVCLDCAAELTMDAPRPPAVTSSTPLNSFICSNSTAISHAQNQNQNQNSLFSSNDRQITQAKAMRWVLILTQLGQESLAPRPTCDTCLTSVGYPISISCSLCTAARPQRFKAYISQQPSV